MPRAFGWLVLVGLGGCIKVEYLEIQPKDIGLRRKNDAIWVKCLGKNRAGHEVPKVKCAWSVADEKIAVVDADGKLSGRTAGQTTLIAKGMGLEAEAMVRIESVERIEIEPAALEFVPGAEPRAVAVRAYTYGNRRLTDRKPEYRTQDPEVASLADEKIWPGQPGETTVKIYVDDESVELPVRVLARGAAAKPGKPGRR